MTDAAGRRCRPPILLLLVALPTTLVCDVGPDESGDGPAGQAYDATAADSVADGALPAPHVEADGLVVEDLLVAEPVTGERAALYLTVRSTGGDVLVGVEAVGADSASLHETSMDEGVMRMRAVTEIPVPAEGQAALRPGGLHAMLEGLAERWAAGDTVRLRLLFRDAGVVRAPALVIPYIELDTRFRDARGGR